MTLGRDRSPVAAVLLFTLACGGATGLLLWLTGTPWHWGYAAVLVYLGGITLLLHRWQERALVEDPKGFVRRFMTGLTLKMFVSIVAVAVVLLTLPRDRAVPLALAFALLYLAFLGFSTGRLVNLSRRPPRP
ncbi:MAG: hypothetical protein IT228_02380 [Flavobacteriales bacterium]|nr:hypothetical protein [Flavobacteriales bacterium]MCC6576164.1 hypothetical protein [Flavobacteriales bacterium]NUQ14826.1 hypothetical protein [Flavobacteriales bacterium]